MAHATTPIAVLLVEDEVLISELVADALSEQGFAVHEAATGDQALRYIKSGADVDIMFTDINLPGEVDGAELARRVRAMRPDIPIVYASGRYSASGLGGMVSRSMFVSKPYDPVEVGTLLARLTESIASPH